MTIDTRIEDTGVAEIGVVDNRVADTGVVKKCLFSEILDNYF